MTWAVGDTIASRAPRATARARRLPASALRWALSLRHCSRADATSATPTRSRTTSASPPAASSRPTTSTRRTSALADRDRRRRPEHDRDDAAEPEDRGRHAGQRRRRPAALVRQRDPGHAVHAHGDRALRDLGERAVAAVARGRELPVGSWSDGLGPTHAVTAPASGSATFTATYAGTAAATSRARTGRAERVRGAARHAARSSA